MKNLHPFLITGAVGVILIAILHIFMTWGLSLTSTHSTFYILYAVFITFFIMGFALTFKNQKDSKSE
jgi:hypothetical protein